MEPEWFSVSSTQIARFKPKATGGRIDARALQYLLGAKRYADLLSELDEKGSALLSEFFPQ